MNRRAQLIMLTLPMVLGLGCQSGPGISSYSSAEQERTMVHEMNLHRPGKTGLQAASRLDNMALREDLSEHPIVARESQATSGTVYEMLEGEDLPRPE